MTTNEVLNHNKQICGGGGRCVRALLETAGRKDLIWNIYSFTGGKEEHFRRETDKLKVIQKGDQ